MSATFTNISTEQLKKALTIKEKIEELTQELDQLLGGAPRRGRPPGKRRGRPPGSSNAKQKGRRRVSAAARAKLAAAAKKRWKAAKAAGKSRL